MTGPPILVGAGQYCERVDDPGYEGLAPAAIAARAGARALADAGGRLNDTIDVVASTRTFADMGAAPAPFGTSTNFPRSIAARLGLDPEHAYWDRGGGNSPQQLVNLMCERLATSQARAVLIAGGEATATVRHLQRTGDQPSWAETVSGSVCDQGWGLQGLLTRELIAHGLSNVPAAYALLENARRHHLGTGRDDYARAMAQLFAPFTEVAATNPYSAAATTAMSAAELLREGAGNRVIASPYPLSLVARDQGNQGAALVLTTAEHAHRVRCAGGKWIYLHGHADLTERPILDRPQLGAYPAAVAASRTALDDAGLDVADIAFFDFYSCFPIAVSAVAVDGLGLAPDDPRGLTVTGGMPYFGGPGNNYSLHAIAEMARRLRAQPGSFGFIGANGGFLSKYSAAVYSTSPAVWNDVDHCAVQHELDRAPGVEREPRPDGPGVVETFTVIHTRGKPSTGVVIGRLIDSDARFIATTIDGDEETLHELLSEQPQTPLGRRVQVTTTGRANRFAFSSARMQAVAPSRRPGLREDYDFCRADIRGHVLEVTIDRPEVSNALHPPASEELAEVFDAFDADPELWVAIITGAGTSAFCAGNDLKWSASGRPVHFPTTGFAGLTTRPGREKPVIAAVNGYAMGGGFEICLASDLVIADDAAQFALSEVQVGLIAGSGGVVRLPRQIPAKIANEYILTGRTMSAATALHWGLVNRVVATGTALAAARDLAAQIVHASPTSVRLSMRAIGEAANHGDPVDAIRAQTAILDELLTSEDAGKDHALSPRSGPRRGTTDRHQPVLPQVHCNGKEVDVSIATTDTEKKETTLATLVARMEIESVQANFLHGLDDRDSDRWLSAFHPDAVLDLEEAGLFTGHDEIMNSARAMWQLEQTTHLTGLGIIDVVDDEHATGVSRGIGMFALGDNTVGVKSVRISDRFTRRAGEWKLAHRNVHMISQFTVDTNDEIRRLETATAAP